MEIIIISHNGLILKGVAVKQGQGEDIMNRLIEVDLDNELTIDVYEASQKLPELMDYIMQKQFRNNKNEKENNSIRTEKTRKAYTARTQRESHRTRKDRTVHGLTKDGAEVVRYNTAGKWWIEYPNNLRDRRKVTISEAVDLSYTFLVGKSGGLRFDAIARERYPENGK